MRNSKSGCTKPAVVGGVLACLLISSAQAAYVNYNVSMGHYENFTLSISGQAVSGMVGEIKLTETAGDSKDLLPSTYSTVCLDLLGTLYVPKNYGFAAPVDFGLNTGWSPMWGQSGTTADAYAGIQHAADLFYKHAIQGNGWANDATHWSALQLAVWETLYDTHVGNSATAYDIGSGRFRATGNATAINLADTWLDTVNMSALYDGSLLKPDPQIQYSLTGQELFINVTPVPEPTTVIAGALLLLPFGASTLRFLRQRRKA